MVVNFEVGKTYVYNGKIGDPSPFAGIGIEKRDALFIVSGKLLVCTHVENSSCPFIKFDGMSSPKGWALNSRYHLFDEVEKKTVVKEEQKEEQKEEKKEMPKFEFGGKYRYTGPSDSVLDFIRIGIDCEDAERIVSGEPLTVEFSRIGNRIKFKEFRNSWSFFSNMLEKFEEVPAPMHGEPVISPDKEYIARQLEWIARNGVKAGTKVRVTRTAESHEDGWDNSWVSSMDKNIGKTGTVDCSIGTMHGLYIDFGDEACREYPFFVLEVVDGKCVPAPSSEVDWEKKYAELEKRYNKLKGLFVEYLMDEKVEFDKLQW